MSDNFDEHARTFNRHGGIGGLAAEIDALRTENQRLRAFIEKVALFCNDPQLSREAWTITPNATLASHKGPYD